MQDKDWGPDWLTRYRESFIDYFEPYKQGDSEGKQQKDAQRSSKHSANSELLEVVGLDQSNFESKEYDLTNYLKQLKVLFPHITTL